MKNHVVSLQAIPAFTVGIAVAVGGMTMAQDTGTDQDQVTVTRLSQREISEKLDGNDASATVELVTIAPGRTDPPHRHSGPVFGYVLEGEYEHALDDEPIKTFKAGETFYEPSGSVHRVTKNPSSKAVTRLLAVVLHGRDTREPTVRLKGQE